MAETAMVDGVTTRYEVHGAGVPIVYTPGAFYSLETARPVAEASDHLGDFEVFTAALADRIDALVRTVEASR